MGALRPLEAQEAVNKLCDHLLGDDWYIVDPVCNIQANAIIVDEIISRYKGATESPVNKWRRSRLHRRCEFCKHFVAGALGCRDVCSAKNKRTYGRTPRPFCSCFQLIPYKESQDVSET